MIKFCPVAVLLFWISQAWGIALGTVDDFQDGTFQDWAGAADENVATGGPAGAGDRFLRCGVGSFANFHPHLAIKNFDPRWTGNFTAAGVTQIEADIQVIEGSALDMRVVLFGGNGGFSRATSTSSISVPADGQWHHLTFPIGPSDLTVVLDGGDTPATMLAKVSELMLRHQSGDPSTGGSPISTNVGFDNIKASASVSITQWRSVRTHTGAGPLPIVLDPAASGNGIGGPTVETRQGGILKIEAQFSGATSVSGSAVTVTGRTTLNGVLQGPVTYTPAGGVSMVNATTVQILFDPGQLPDQTCYTIDISPGGVPGLTGDHDVMVRSLAGDATMSGLVSLSDAILIAARTGGVVSANPQYDVNLDGSILLGDALAAKGAIRHLALCP